MFRDAAIIVGPGMGRIQRDGPVVIRDGRVVAAEGVLRVAAIVVGPGQGALSGPGA